MPDSQTVSHSQPIFDQKNDFNFLALVQSKIEQFSLKTYKISEQQINPKVLPVANSCHYNENPKNGKHRFQTNVRPSGATPTNPMQRPQGGGKFLVQIPGGARGGDGYGKS